MTEVENGIEPDVLYEVHNRDGSVSYGRTPDGIGMIWYDSLDECADDLPEGAATVSVTTDELDVLRGEAEPPPGRCPETGGVHHPDESGVCSFCGEENTFHVGHFGMSQWWCDTCNSPYCELA